MTDNCLTVLGTLSNSAEFYRINGISAQLLHATFTFSEFTSTRSLNQIIVLTVIKIIRNCPADRYQDVLLAILPSILNFISSRLNQEWIDLEKRGIQLDRECDEFGNLMDEMNRAEGDQMEDITEEIALEQMLRTLTRNVSGKFLASLFSVEKEVAGYFYLI